MKKNKFQNGKVNVLPDVIEDKDVTIHISLKIEGDLLRAIRALAEKEHLPYQTKLKQMLRAQLQSPMSRAEDPGLVDQRLAALEANYRKLEKIVPMVATKA